MNKSVLFISDKKYIISDILGGVQLCTHEYIKYLKYAGFEVEEFHVAPDISLLTKIKIRAGIDVYDHYSIDQYLQGIISAINSANIKLVFFNQLNLAFWTPAIKLHVAADVKFIGLSHGNESADYLHDITRQGSANKLQTWKLGKLMVNEARLFSTMLNGLVVLSEQEAAINQWMGVSEVLFLPRILAPDFIKWNAAAPNAGFVGTLDHLPNLLGIKQLAAALQKRGFRYELQLVGGPEHTGKRLEQQFSFIRYKGPVSDNKLLGELSSWSVFANPVFWYARGSSTKLTRAINLGIPCITTPAGARGYHLTNDEIITDDNTPDTFAEALIKALDHPAELDRLKKATEDNANNFDVQPFVTQLKMFLNKIAGT